MRFFPKNILRFFPILWFLILSLLVFGKTLFSPAGQIIFGSDLLSSHYYKFMHVQQSIHNGTIPFWNPYNFSGIPLLANPNAGSLFYPFNIIFLFLPLSAAFAVYELTHVVFAGITMYWLLRQRIDRLSATAGATVFAFSGFMAAQTYMGHIELIASMAFIPLVFGLFQNLLLEGKKRDLLFATGALTLQILLGSPIMVMFTLELVGLYFLFHAIQMVVHRKPARAIAMRIILFIFAISLALGLASVQLFPVTELSSQSIRANGLPYELSSRGALELWQLPLFFNPFIFGHPILDLFPSKYFWPDVNEFNYFIGVIPILVVFGFSIISFIRIIKRRKIDTMVLFCLIAVGFFSIMALGNKAYVYRVIYELVPLSRFFRIPVRNLTIVVFLFSFLYGWICSRINIPFVRILFIGIAAFELVTVYKTLTVIRSVHQTYDEKTLNYIKKNIGDARVYPRYYSYQDVAFFFDVNDSQQLHIFSVNGYDELISNKYYRFFELMKKEKTDPYAQPLSEVPLISSHSRYLDFLSVKYIINSTFDDNDLGDDVSGKFQLVNFDNTYHLYENTTYLPRFFLVPTIIAYDGQQKLEKALHDEIPDLNNSIVITREEATRSRIAGGLNCGSNISFNPVKTLSYTSNNLLLEVQTPCNAVLSTSEAYYPGWHARVDGKEVPIILSNLAFRAIVVPQGIHKVEMYYSPDIYIRGILVSLGTLIVVFALYRFLPASLLDRVDRPQ